MPRSLSRPFILTVAVMIAAPAAAKAQSFVVAELGSNDVAVYNLTGGSYQRALTITGPNLSSPYGIALSGNDIYISSLGSDTIFKYTGGTLQTFATPTTPGIVNGLVVDGSGNVYVANYGPTASDPGSLLVFNASGVQTASYTSPLLNGPTALTLNNGNLFIANSKNDNVLQFNTTTHAFSNYTAVGSLGAPAGLAFGDSSGTLVASSFYNNYNGYSGGTGLTSFNSAGTAISHVNIAGNPAGVATDGNGAYFVSNYSTGTLSEYTTVAGMLQPLATTLISGLNNPNRFAYSGTTLNTGAAPEPSSIALTLIGVGGLIATRYRRRRALAMTA